MKKHAIIPIFIPHRGCNNDCVFCNQKIITARGSDIRPQDISQLIDDYLNTLQNRHLDTIEVAFYGGSFTGIPIEQQTLFLRIAQSYKQRGLIDKIHLSTRPDYIDERILENLKIHQVDIIELGVQSFDAQVLLASNRGHTREQVFDACRLIKDYGFTLGVQLMVGLPEDTHEKCIQSAYETVAQKPELARIYPTIVLKDTQLYSMYRAGTYTPLSLEEALRTTKDVYRILDSNGINIIRVGLKSTDLVNQDGEILGSTFHPAFRQLVESLIAQDKLERQLLRYNTSQGMFDFCSSSNSFSNMIGHNKSNKLYFQSKYPNLKIKFKVDTALDDKQYVISRH